MNAKNEVKVLSKTILLFLILLLSLCFYIVILLSLYNSLDIEIINV